MHLVSEKRVMVNSQIDTFPYCTHRGSLRRLGLDQLALGQLHWSVAKYAPPLERALWDGLAAIYDEVQYVCFQP